MTDEKSVTTEVLDNTKPTEDENTVTASDVEDIAKETINENDTSTVETPDEEVTLDNVKLPEEKKELTNADYILKRKEDKIQREKTRLINEKDSEIDRLKQAHEEASKRAFVAEVNAYKAPIREDFENDEDFIDSRLQYNIAKTTAERIRQQEQANTEKSKEIFSQRLNKAEQIGQDKYNDFDHVTEQLGKPGILTNIPLIDAVLDSEYSADVFYLMGKYPAIREKLNNMEPIKAIKELAKLEQRFEQQLKSKKVTKTDSKIIEPIKGSNGTSTKKSLMEYSEAELAKLSNREFTKLRKEEAKSYTY